MAKEKRFIRVFEENSFATGNEIWIDTQTGVNYLFHQSGYSGGLTPLLGADGKPVVTPRFELENLVYNSR